ncbi:hypothetical protein [Nocardiopsis synnemataformans]
MFLLPNNVRRDDLIALLHDHLREIRTRVVELVSGARRVTRAGLKQP